MRQRTQGTPKEKLYHSQVAKQKEGQKLRFMSDVKDSKFADGNPYVFVELPGDREAMFFIENEEIRTAINNVPQKTWVTMRCEGFKDSAWVTFGNDKPDTPPEAKPLAAPQPLEGGPEPDPEVNDWKLLVIDVCDAAALAYARMETNGHPFDSAGKASVWSTIFIAMDRRA